MTTTSLTTAATEATGHPGRQVGLGCSGCALSIKNIPTGAGDVINIQARLHRRCDPLQLPELGSQTYCDVRQHRLAGAYQSIGFAAAPDAVLRRRRRHQHRDCHDLGLPRCATPTTGIPTGTPRSTVPTLRLSTARWPRPRSAAFGGHVRGAGRRYHLQPGLRHRSGRYHHPLDPGQEPDLLGGRRLYTMLDQKYAGTVDLGCRALRSPSRLLCTS